MKRTGPATVFRDVLVGTIGIIVFAWFISLVQISQNKKKDDGTKPPGNVTVFITWPEGDTDIDLWVTGPGEPYPVGYSNKGGVLWNLLRDDLGTFPDLSGINMESSYSRGSPAGEYIINLHCFRCAVLPQKVNVEVGLSANAETGKGTMTLATATIELKANGQERTAIRFKLDGKSGLVPGSISSVFQELRAAGKQGGGFGQ